MKLNHTRCAHIGAALFVSLFTSHTFAQVIQVPDRATLGATDIINWEDQGEIVGPYTVLWSPDIVPTAEGTLITVAQREAYGLIDQEPSGLIGPTNLPPGDFLYETNSDVLDVTNPISFSDFDGRHICGLGTQVAPVPDGEFTARIEAFDKFDVSMGFFDVTASSDDPVAPFLGLDSVFELGSAEISVQQTEDALQQRAFFAINHVEIKVCPQPVLYCEGFASPMAKYPVKAKGNRALPLKIKLFDEDGFEQTDLELTTPPVFSVIFLPSDGGDAIDVSDDATWVGMGSSDNGFVFSDKKDAWQYNLKPRNYRASGTYQITVLSGDESEYFIDESCETSFTRK